MNELAAGSFDPVVAQRIYQNEHEIRIRYQGLIYLVCAELDHLLGRHVSRGDGTQATEEELLKALRMLRKSDVSSE